MPWPLRPLPQIETLVGRCAWRASMLLDHGAYLREHPSLLVTHPDDSLELLGRLAPLIGGFPVMLSIREPQFSRRVPEMITQRLSALKISTAEFVTLFVEDPSDLKGGATFQHLFELREKKMIRHIALAHGDIRMVEWLAQHTPVPALLMPYHLANQSARYRALNSAFDNGMIPIGLEASWFSNDDESCVKAGDFEAIRFALAEAGRVLPVLDAPIPEGLAAMPLDDVEAAWQAYSSVNPAPPALPRSLPPE